MSIIISDVSYHYFNQHTLFESVSFSVSQGGKVSLIGNNGVGKSTLLKLLAGKLVPSFGNIRTESKPYYVPQQINIKEQTIAEALDVSEKIAALHAIYGGTAEQIYYDTLNDDWDVENRCHQALEYWGLQYTTLESSISLLSGGEKTKVLLAGLALHKPDIVLLDEPTNHLDLSARKKLYEYIVSTKATVVVVSHDVSLLDLLDTTYELSSKGIKLYGGNYDFYREQKAIEDRALEQQIDAGQTALRKILKKAQEVRERQDRRASQGERSKQKGGVARIIMNARGNSAENSSAKLKEKHSGIIDDTQQRLFALRERKQSNAELKIDFEDMKLHSGKVLITAKNLNFGYANNKPLWQSPINLEIRSGDRIHILGNNGSGKTTFVKLLLGELVLKQGEIIKSDFSYVYLDQEYEQVNQSLTILELAKQHNKNNLADHEIKLRLNRALFPQETWNKSCQTLSGGERMRLYLCCLMISNHVPDVFILDEPTNNLDLSSLSILANTIKNYRGTVLIISHDEYFINEIEITSSIKLT
ncbi:MAG: ATP-binding cassette domain-containing protein [Mediterranea sp.]|jgi:ATPase subunit of ABC transporter with duplicated ATPase domains|nr:ATP-binding cassette domain-containing protein [Mediterranea sp.]